jgi:hypothetical protein
MLGAPDVAFSAVSFADSASIAATKIAKKEGLSGQALKDRAAAIFKDAASIDPKTFDGEVVRDQAISDAQYATFTNDSTYSTLALGIRKLFNFATGDLRIGDQIMPFVKTPANVIGGGLDAAGLSAIISTYNLPSAIKELKDGNNEPMRAVIRGYVRSGLGFTLAMILANAFDPDDFIGEYPTSEKERQLLELKNATTNSIKIGNKWVSLDYFGPLGAPLVGMLYAKKYGKGLADSVFRYAQGVATQSTKIPGFNEFYDTVKGFKDARPDTSKSLQENLSGVGTSLLDFIRARVVPAIVYDFAKGTDKFERKVDKAKIFDKFKSTIPGLRETLPVDKTILGKERETEGLISTLLFGARVKTASESETVNELMRLSSTGNLPAITDVEKTSTRVKEYKNQVSPEKYTSTMEKFGQKFGKEIDKLMKTGAYKKLDDEKKADAINKLKDDLLDETLKKGGYKKPKKKSEAPVAEPNKKVVSLNIKIPSVLSLDTFRKMNIFNPPKASAKESTTDKDGYYTGEPFRVEPSDKDGYVKFYYPSGAYSEITKDKVEKYKRLVQDQFEWFGVGKYPKTAEDATKFNDKEVAHIAMVTPTDGKAEVKKTAPLLQKALKDAGIYSKEVLAYALATTQHETANAMKPVDEGYFNDKKYGYEPGFTGRKQAEKRGYEGGSDYFGRGYIQLTHKENYANIGKKIGVDLVNNPEKANDPETAAKILAVYFKERGIDKLVKEGKITEARRLVNPDQKGLLLRTTYKRYLKAMPDYFGR